MNRALLLLVISLFGTLAVVSLTVLVARTRAFADVRKLLGSVFFLDSVTSDGLKAKYEQALRGGEKVRILIVPGHDNESWGTEFRGIREADMTAEVGVELLRLLATDSAYAPILVRDMDEYTPEFRDYFQTSAADVRAFVANKAQLMKDLSRQTLVSREQGVIHRRAATSVVDKLYAINKWANDNRVDIVLHLHFNDYPRRRTSQAGRYSGFALYVPEEQFSNAKASRAVASALFGQLSKFYAASDFPQEDSGIVPDQDLIAVGAYNTLDPVGILIEYGYIYEQKFLDKEIREAFLKDLALQTEIGLNRFFGNPAEALRRYPTAFLPHEWSEPLAEGVSAHPSVLSLQAALLFEDLYPPEKDLRACPLTGSFGKCTGRAVLAFQKKYGLSSTGIAGEQTLQKLNELYGK